MAEEGTKQTPRREGFTTQPAHTAPETHVGRQSSLSTELGVAMPHGQTKPTVQKEPDHGLSAELGTGKEGTVQKLGTNEPDTTVKLGPDGKPLPAAAAATTTEEPAKKEGEEAQGTLPALPSFDPAKPEAVQAYDKAFLGADGKGFNMAALSTDWSKNAKLDPKTGDISGGLSEDTYKFLETKGISRDMAREIEAGQVAKITLERSTVFQMAGGAEPYNAAIAWARQGGYTAEAATAFNEALNKGGAARKDAVDLLMTRHKAANPPARRVSPQRTTADAAQAAGGDGGVKPYANYAEYQKDLRAARATNDQAKLDESRARLKASPWHTGAR